MKHRVLAGSCTLLVLAGCTVPPAAPTKGGSSEGKGKASAAPVVTTGSPVLDKAAGQVLGLDGKPAAGVKIKAYVISNDGASVISNDGASLIGNDGASVIAPNGAGYGLLAAAPAPIEATTDANGAFKLTLPGGAKANVEAVLSDAVKAIKLGATSTQGLVLNLDHTGAIAGKVVPPAGSTATNLTGVDVFVPGTSYAAKTDAGGAFTIQNVPAAALPLVASKTGLGQASGQVTVKPGATATAPDLALALDLPTIASLSPAVGAPGAKITIKGSHFGASTADPFTVAIAGSTVANPKRIDDQTIEVTLPDNAGSGDVVVTVAGTPGPAAKLVVAKALAFATTIQDLWVGSTLPLTALVVDVDLKILGDVPLTWQADGAAVAVDAKGVATAKAEGTAKLTAAVGDLKAALDLRVHAAPFITTLAGSSPLAALSGATAGTPSGKLLINVGDGDGIGAQVSLGQPWGVVPAPDGGVYVAEGVSNLIRKISPAGQVTTVAGHFDLASVPGLGGLPQIGAGSLKDGKGDAARFSGPRGLALDAQGNLIVADAYNCRIRKVAPDGTVTTIAGGGPATEVTGGGGGYKDGPALEAQFASPSGVAVGPNGDIFIADEGNHVIRKLTTAGQVTTVAGTSKQVGVTRTGGYVDGAGGLAMFSGPEGVAVAADGTLYVADTGNGRIRKITPEGQVSTLAGGGASNNSVDPVLFRDGKGDQARFYLPSAIAFDADGSLLVADSFNGAVRQVALDGTVTTLVGKGSSGFAAQGPAQDGLLASATLGQVPSLAVGADGAIYLTDLPNGCVRKIVRKAP